jgi:hypothetical protein
MISRGALIIGSPDEEIPGVNIDIKNINTYLKSPIGGLWHEREIKNLDSPSVSEVKKEIDLLRTKDYSLIFFAGHGYYSVPSKSTIVQLNSQDALDSLELRLGAKKHTLILDCCRKSENDHPLLKAAMESMVFDSARGQGLNASECREFFDTAISKCDAGIVVINSCSIDETAGENEINGGYYTSSLIDSANEWAKATLIKINLAENYSTFSTHSCHKEAASKVIALSGNRQHPSFESPRTTEKFPFAVVA